MGAVKIIRLSSGWASRHTGATADAAALCIDKPRSKARLVQCGVPTPRYQVFERPEGECHLAYPLIVKPSIEDASMGIELDSVICEACNLFPRVEYITGEIPAACHGGRVHYRARTGVAMWGNGNIEVLPIAEDDFFPDPQSAPAGADL